MYGGDEVSAIVVDVGSTNVRAGYAGEDTPKSVLPSAVGYSNTATENGEAAEGEKPKKSGKYYVGTTALSYRRDHMMIKNPLSDGLVSDWEAYEQLLNHVFSDTLHADVSTHPILMAEAAFNSKACREKQTELLFETYKVPAAFMCKSASLSSYAAGKQTALVLDCGGGSTTAVPVHDGYVLQKGIVRWQVGGDKLSDILSQICTAKGVDIRPHYMLSKEAHKKRDSADATTFKVNVKPGLENTHPSYKQLRVQQIVQDAKELLCRVSDQPFSESDASAATVQTESYELPDGNSIELGSERYALGEMLFNPATTCAGIELPPPMRESGGLCQMVHQSVTSCAADIHKDLFNAVVVTGAGSSMNGLNERLQKDLQNKVQPFSTRVKLVQLGGGPERRFSVWIGGSILASLGSFHQMWMSKAQYDEHGTSLVHTQCP